MRVIAGKARRLQLETPAGLATRPTSDQIKETLFNILQNEVPEACFLDLFAGRGGIGIEALSRGARYACFVDNSREAVKCIKDNLNHTKLADAATVYAQDWMSALARMESEHRVFDIIFMDPPYEQGTEAEVLRYLASSKLIHADTLIVVEASIKTPIEETEGLGFRVERIKQYKTNQHWFLRGEE